MTPQELRASILQQAIQGKLVEQRPEEDTGEELFQQIQAEKQILIKAGKIKKEKPLPEIADDEIPFDIPETWKWVRWGDLSQSIQYGYNAPAQDKGRIKMVRISDIQDGEVIWETVPYCEIKEEDIPTYLLAPNDILFARTGGTVGKSYLVKDVPEDAIYAGYLIRTQYSSMLCPGYMKHFMESKLYWDQLRNGTIATAQPNCNGKTLAKMILPLPPLEEQQRIVAKLEEILPLIDRYEAAWNKLEEFNKRFPGDMQKSILQLAIQGKLVEQRPEEGTGEELFQRIQAEKQALIKAGKIKKEKPLPEIAEDEIPFDIPDTWKWMRVGNLAVVQSSKRVFEKDYVSEGIPFFRSKEIGNLYRNESIKTELFITEEHYAALAEGYGVPQVGDILITSVGTIGNTWICDGRKFYYKDGNITQICGNRFFDSRYVEYFLHSPLFEKQALSTVAGTAYSALTIIKLKNLIIPLPPLVEQKRIVAKLEEILPLCDRLK